MTILDRGPMPYFITLMTCWGVAMLVMKYVAVKRQLGYAELELELIPLEIGVQITPDNVDQFARLFSCREHVPRRSLVESQSNINADYWLPVRDNLKARYGEAIVVLGWGGAAGPSTPSKRRSPPIRF